MLPAAAGLPPLDQRFRFKLAQQPPNDHGAGLVAGAEVGPVVESAAHVGGHARHRWVELAGLLVVPFGQVEQQPGNSGSVSTPGSTAQVDDGLHRRPAHGPALCLPRRLGGAIAGRLPLPPLGQPALQLGLGVADGLGGQSRTPGGPTPR